MDVRMLNLELQNEPISDRLLAAASRVARSQSFILGPEVEAFERACQEFLGVGHAVGVSNGSDALVCALLAAGVLPGTEVVTTPFSFFATAESILRVGAIPRFADIEADTFALNPARAAEVMGPRTFAILAVHLYGQPARLDGLLQLAQGHAVPLLEDSAQAFGAKIAQCHAGTLGQLGCFSFQPTKPLGGWGDSGLVVTNDALLAERCRQIRVHGAAAKHEHTRIGGNYRMDALQAAVLREKLTLLPGWLTARRAHAIRYDSMLQGLPDLVTPKAIVGTEANAALYTVRVLNGKRNALRDFLMRRGIETAVHYPLPLHRQPALVDAGCGANPGTFPEAERAASEVLSLPLYPELPPEQLEYVALTLREYFGSVRSG